MAGKGVLSNRIENALSASAKGVTVRWESMDILPLSPGIRLRNLSIEIRSRKGGDANTVARAHAAEAELRGLHLVHLLRHGKIRADLVRLRRWSGRLSGSISAASFQPDLKKDVTPHVDEKITSAVILGRMLLEDGQLEWAPKAADQEPAVAIQLEKLEWSPARHRGLGLQAMAGPVRIHLPRTQSVLSMRTIRLNPTNRLVEIGGVHLQPRWPVYKYSRKRGFQTDRIELRVDQVLLQWPHGGYPSSTPPDGKHPVSVVLKSPQLEVFRDRRVLRRKGPRKRKPLPYQVLKRIQMPFQIGEIKIQNGRVVFGEHNRGSRVPGKLSFDTINGWVHDFHMGPANIANCPAIRMEINCRLRDRIPTTINFTMEPGNPRFRLEGRMGSVNLPSLNPTIVPLAFLRIDRGRMEELRFRLDGNHLRLTGDVRVRYKDLKISMVKRSDPGERRGLASFLANAVLFSSNPKKNKALHAARVDLPRDPRRSFFNWLWRGILAGLKRSAGL